MEWGGAGAQATWVQSWEVKWKDRMTNSRACVLGLNKLNKREQMGVSLDIFWDLGSSNTVRKPNERILQQSRNKDSNPGFV